METRGPPPWTGYLLRDCYQTLTNSQDTYRGDSGHLGPTSRSTPNLERHLEKTMGFTVVGRNGFTQVRCDSMDSGTHNSESLPGRDSNLGPPYHVYNRTRSPKICRNSQTMVASLTGLFRTGGAGMVVHSIGRHLLSGMPNVREEAGQRSPRHDTMPEMPGKYQ